MGSNRRRDRYSKRWRGEGLKEMGGARERVRGQGRVNAVNRGPERNNIPNTGHSVRMDPAKKVRSQLKFGKNMQEGTKMVYGGCSDR